MEYLKSHGDEPIWSPAVIPEKQEKQKAKSGTNSEPEQISSETEEAQLQTYESFADRLPNVKKERNKRLYRRLTFIVSIFLLAIVIASYIVSPLSKLGTVTVTGNKVVDKNEVIVQSKLEQGKNLWSQFADRKENEQLIEKNVPRVKKASISLNGIRSFNIKVEEYNVVALESEKTGYHPILENGKILTEEVKAPTAGLPIFQSFNNQTVVKNLITSYNKLPQEMKKNIAEIRYTPSKSNKELINLHMKDKNIVIIDISQLSDKMTYYNKVASQMKKAGTIDMEVGIFSYPFDTNSADKSTEDSTQSEEQN